MVLLAVPLNSTNCVPPLIVVLVAVPKKTFCWPPLIVVLMAVAPDSTA